MGQVSLNVAWKLSTLRSLYRRHCGLCGPLFAVVGPVACRHSSFSPLTTFGATTLFTVKALSRRKRQKPATQSLGNLVLPAVMVSIGQLVSNIFFLAAIGYMPAPQANLILYLWPLMIAVMAAPLGLVALRRLHLVSIALGLCGAALIIGLGNLNASLPSIALAVAGGFSWAILCVYRLWQGPGAPDALATGFVRRWSRRLSILAWRQL